MKSIRYMSLVLVAIFLSTTLNSGCALNFYKQSKRDRQKIQKLQGQISDLEAERQREKEQFEEVQSMLQQRLRSQIDNDTISLEMTDRGLVIILSDDVLFDSGKAEMKEDAKPVLDKVATIINNKVPGKNIGVSGHTDNVPITHSNWKSNWELSASRATNVLHYLAKKGVLPNKLSATGYGEHRPVATNATASGRAKNRRVEIVILPEFQEERAEDISALSNIVK